MNFVGVHNSETKNYDECQLLKKLSELSEKFDSRDAQNQLLKQTQALQTQLTDYSMLKQGH